MKKHAHGLSQEVLERSILAGRDDAELPGDLGHEDTATTRIYAETNVAMLQPTP